MSYPVITPSAARGIFDAIFWQKGLYWQLERVEVLKPPRFIAIRRNEVKNKADSTETILGWISGRETPEPLWADAFKPQVGTDLKGRTQRQTIALRDVAYRLHARLRHPKGRPVPVQEMQFERRARAGRSFHQPYFGCREFACYFEPAGSSGPAPYPLDLDLGLMLYDVFPLGTPGTGPSASLFRATVRGGVMEIPRYESDLVLKGTEGA